MHKFIAIIIGTLVAYMANRFLGEGQRNSIISIIIGIIIAFIVWMIPI
jgi:putative flippase GtrA